MPKYFVTVFFLLVSSSLVTSLVSSLAFAETAKVANYKSPQAALAVLKRFPNRGTVVNLLQRYVNHEDGQAMRNQASFLALDLRAPQNLQAVGPLSFRLQGLKHTFEIAADGKSIKYGTAVFRRDKTKTFKEHLDFISKALSETQTNSFLDLILPSAHASADHPTADGFNAATILYFLDTYQFTDDFSDDAMTKVPEIKTALNKIKKKVKSISCKNTDEDGGAHPYNGANTLKIEYFDGTKDEITWDGVQGDNDEGKIAINGNLTSGENRTYFGSAEYYFCQKLHGNGRAQYEVNRFFQDSQRKMGDVVQ